MASVVEEILKIEEKEKQSVKQDEAILGFLCDSIIESGMYPESFVNELKELKSSSLVSSRYEVLKLIPMLSAFYVIDGEQTVWYRDSLYELLEKAGYNFNSEIKMVIREICTTNGFNKYDASSLEDKDSGGYKSVRKIGINNEDGSYTIYGHNDGEEYKFYRADTFFANNEQLMEYIRENAGKNECHKHTEFLQSVFPEGVSITSYCPRFMGSNYYAHSYMEINGMIVDLNFNMVMDKESYYRLIQPTELIRINNNEVEGYKEAVEHALSNDPDKEKLSDHYFMLVAAELNLINQSQPDLYQSIGEHVTPMPKAMK